MLFSRIYLKVPKHEYAKFKDKCDFFDTCPKDIMTQFIILFNEGKLDDTFGVPELPELQKAELGKSTRMKLNGNWK